MFHIFLCVLFFFLLFTKKLCLWIVTFVYNFVVEPERGIFDDEGMFIYLCLLFIIFCYVQNVLLNSR